MEEINWKTAKTYEDITYQKCNGVARIAFNRPNGVVNTTNDTGTTFSD